MKKNDPSKSKFILVKKLKHKLKGPKILCKE